MTTNHTTWTKDPDAILDYEFNWAPWLDVAETIVSHVVTPETGITMNSHVATTTAVTVWLTGGTDGTDYDVACKISTSASRTDERTITIKVRNR